MDITALSNFVHSLQRILPSFSPLFWFEYPRSLPFLLSSYQLCFQQLISGKAFDKPAVRCLPSAKWYQENVSKVASRHSLCCVYSLFCCLEWSKNDLILFNIQYRPISYISIPFLGTNWRVSFFVGHCFKYLSCGGHKGQGSHLFVCVRAVVALKSWDVMSHVTLS